jgi:hypothetical protein
MLQCTNNAETKLVVAPSMQSPATAQHVSTVAIIVSVWAVSWLFGWFVGLIRFIRFIDVANTIGWFGW